jgi:hypothetical protein
MKGGAFAPQPQAGRLWVRAQQRFDQGVKSRRMIEVD